MRIQIMFVRLLVLTLVALCSDIMATENAERSDLEIKIVEVAQEEGAAYLQGRKGLEVTYRERRKEFDELLKTTADWRVKNLGGIVRERATKAKEIARFMNTEMQIGSSPRLRGITELIAENGDDMALKGKDTPMVLVEKIWKGNELHNYRLRESAGCASVLYAIRKMWITDARPIVENILTNDAYFALRPEIVNSASRHETAIADVKSVAAVTLELWGNPRSIPALVTALDKGCQNNGYEASYAGDAIKKCMDASSLPYLEKAIENHHNEKFIQVIKDIIQQIEKKQAVTDKSTTVTNDAEKSATGKDMKSEK